jgi:hypothetical protein
MMNDLLFDRSSPLRKTRASENGASKNGKAARPALCVFFGHHKCATGWISGIVREICFHLGGHLRIVPSARHIRPRSSLGAFVEEEGVDVLAYTNAAIEHARALPPHRGFHVVRDPRDVLVSAYFSHRYSHPAGQWPALQAHREKLKSLSKKEGLFREMEFSRGVFEQMQRWDYEQEHVLEVKLEELSAHPRERFMEIARFLGLLDEKEVSKAAGWKGAVQMRLNRLNQRGRRFMPGRLPMFPVPQRRLPAITAPMLRTILHRKRFEKMAGGREKGEEDVTSHYRKGQPGDWKNHFDDELAARFKDEYNDVLLKLGYETTPDW